MCSFVLPYSNTIALAQGSVNGLFQVAWSGPTSVVSTSDDVAARHITGGHIVPSWLKDIAGCKLLICLYLHKAPDATLCDDFDIFLLDFRTDVAVEVVDHMRRPPAARIVCTDCVDQLLNLLLHLVLPVCPVSYNSISSRQCQS